MNKQNLFTNIPDAFTKEIFEKLAGTNSFKLERILSNGQATPAGEWYDQEKSEWVLLLKGSAAIRFENEAEIIELHPGDYLTIAPHQKHRVEWTDKQEPTVWLALHF